MWHALVHSLTGKPLHHVWKEHMNYNLELHRKLELCLRLGCYLEDILNLYPDDYVLPGVSMCAVLLHKVYSGKMS